MHGNVAHLAPGIGASLTNNPHRRALVAHALVRIMRSEAGGFSTGQAIIAADLYRAWQLPFEFANSLASDPNASFRSRVVGINALSHYWNDPRYLVTAVSAACAVGARAEGLLNAMTDPPRLELLLNEDEMELIDELIASLSHSSLLDSFVRQIQAVLPAENPIKGYLLKELTRGR
jgi:hypothetical protein